MVAGPAVAGGGGFGGNGRPGVGVGAYAPGQGPTGAAAWSAGALPGNVRGFRGGGRFYGGGSGTGGSVAIGGRANVYNYNYNDRRRNDGGFYGGGGVFYGDNGYSRLPPVVNSGPSQHVIYLPDSASTAGN